MKNHFNYLLSLFAGLGLLLLSFLQPLQARPALAETSLPAIDAYIEARMQDLQIPGLAVAIVRGDRVEYVRGYGTAGTDGRRVTPQTPFLIASLSKSFTALGIMQLVEDGKLRLDAPVQEYLPWFQVADAEISSQLTIRQLLHQTSGFSELEGYERDLEKDSSDGALEASVRRLGGSRLNAAPGEGFEYSNTNYDLLGLVIQTVSKKPYEAYIEERIFAPLSMQNSFTSLSEARAGGVSSGYASFFGATVIFDRFMPYSRTVTPSAGLFASAEDIAQYLYAHINEGRSPDGGAILTPAGTAELHAPGVKINEQVSYAMGWTVFPFPQAAAANNSGSPIPTGLAHGGEWANFRAVMLLIPEQKLGIAVLMNKNDYRQGAAYDDICWNTALLALGLEPEIASGSGDFLTKYGLFVGAAVLLALIASLAWSARSLSQSPARNPGERSHWQYLAFFVILPVVDLAVSGYLLLVDLPQSNSSLPLALSFQPDTGLIYLSLLALTLGWGALRTALAIRKLPGRGKSSALREMQ